MADPANEIVPTTEQDESAASAKDQQKDMETSTAVSEESNSGDKSQTAGPIVSSSKKTRPPYKFDPDKITMRFLFANRDGLTVTIECSPNDTVGEVKASLMSVWPEGLPECTDGDQLRLICMGKGYLMPDSRTLGELEIPVFKTHPTPINVSLRPEVKKEEEKSLKSKKETGSAANSRGAGRSGTAANGDPANQEQTSQGCACILL